MQKTFVGAKLPRLLNGRTRTATFILSVAILSNALFYSLPKDTLALTFARTLVIHVYCPRVTLFHRFFPLHNENN